MGDRLKPEDTVLVVVDVQEKFEPHILGWDGMLEKTIKLIRGFQLLNMPVLVSEQYPKGLGETVQQIRDVLEFTPIKKTSFSLMADEGFKKALEETGRQHVVLCGIESHVCVLNTAIDLMDDGFIVHLPLDAVGSRNEKDMEVAQIRLIQEGALPETAESILFQLIKDSRDRYFKKISAIVK